MWVSLPGVSWSNKFNPLFVLGLIKFVFVPMVQCGATQLEAGLKTCLDMYIYTYICLTHVQHKL